MTNSAFAQFLSNASGTHIAANRKLIGYLLHSFTDEKSFAVSIANTPPGNIIVQAIKSIKTVVDVDCRKLDILSHRHTFGAVNSNTDIVLLKQLPTTFNVDDLRHIVTKGITVDSAVRYNLPATYHPKIICSGFFLDKLYLRKMWLLNQSPEAEYKPFFKNWYEDDWNEFYQEMAACVKEWL